MAARVRIGCITKVDRQNVYERITHVGGSEGGQRWLMTQRDAIDAVKHDRYSFYVENPIGHVADVVVARSLYGHEYLKTVADGETPNNLLSLSECPL